MTSKIKRIFCFFSVFVIFFSFSLTPVFASTTGKCITTRFITICIPTPPKPILPPKPTLPPFFIPTPTHVIVGATLRNYIQPVGKSCNINVPAQFNTIQAAINTAVAGNTICVGPGTYNEDVYINKSIRLSGKGDLKSIINGKIQQQNGTVMISSTNVIVEGFLIHGLDSSSAETFEAIHLLEQTSGVIIRYNKIIAGNKGISLLTDNAQHNILIQDNILEGNNSPFVVNVGQFDNNKPSDKVDFLNNSFTGTVNPTDRSDTGITLNAGAPNSLIQRNVFNTSGTMVSLIGSTNGNKINENNFYSNTTMKVEGTTPIDATNNWWGDPDPSDNVQPGIDYIPFATKPFSEI